MKKLRVVCVVLIAFVLNGSFCDPDEENPVEPRPDGQPTSARPYYPADYSTEQSRTPVFFWDGRFDPEEWSFYEYTVIVDTTWDFATSWTLPPTRDEFIVYNGVLEPNTKYFWKVRTVTDFRRTATSILRETFTTGTGTNNPPSRPFNCEPTVSDTDISVDTMFTWECFDPDGDQLTYSIWHKEEGDTDSTTVSGLTEQQYPVTLPSDSYYHWRVYARDQHGGVDSSYNTNRFATVRTDPPSDPQPFHGAGGLELPVLVSWTCTDPDGGALTYDVSRGLTGHNLVRIASGLTEAQLEMADLDYATEYDWQVTAEDTEGRRFPGPVWSFTTGADPNSHQGVYAELTVHRSQTYSGTELTRNDHMAARFDSVYAPNGPINPLRPAGVNCAQPSTAGRDLVWSDAWNWYYYDNPVAGNFLGRGQEYIFTITGGDGVPSLVSDPVLFPECGPHITSPAPFSFVTLEGLELVWVNYDSYSDCSRPVTIRIQDLGFLEWTDVNIVTENDGSYTFTAADAALLDPSVYQLSIVLIIDNKENIDAPGYDPRSWVWARTYATQVVYRQ